MESKYCENCRYRFNNGTKRFPLYRCSMNGQTVSSAAKACNQHKEKKND